MPCRDSRALRLRERKGRYVFLPVRLRFRFNLRADELDGGGFIM